jgi:hypothetical protein
MDEEYFIIGNNKNCIIGKASEYQKRRFFDIRKHFFDEDKKKYIPTRKGISLNRTHFNEVMDALSENSKAIISYLEGAENILKQTTNKSNDYVEIKKSTKVKFNNFFESKNNGNHSQLIINENHSFWKNNVQVLGENEATQKAIFALLTSFTKATAMYDPDEQIHVGDFVDNLMDHWSKYLTKTELK